MFMLFIINLSIKSNNFNLVHIFFTISLIVHTKLSNRLQILTTYINKGYSHIFQQLFAFFIMLLRNFY